MSILHTELRMVLLARDVLQTHAWSIQTANPDNFHDDTRWQALQDAADCITDCLEEIGKEID